MKREDIPRNGRARVLAEDGSDDTVEAGVDVLGDRYEVTTNAWDGSITLNVNGEEAALSLEQGAELRRFLGGAA